MSTIAAALKQAREARGLSMAQVAEAVGIDEARLTEIEIGRDEPTFVEGMELLEFFDLEPDAILA